MKELIEQIGRERLEEFIRQPLANGLNRSEIMTMARALLAVLDETLSLDEEQKQAVLSLVRREVRECERLCERFDVSGTSQELEVWQAEYLKHDAILSALMLTPLAASEPVSNGYTLPDGMVIMPRKLTAENGAKHALSGEFFVETREECHECGGRGCEDCGEEGSLEVRLAIDWTTIKEIYSKTVEHFEAAPALGGDGG